MSKSYLEKIRTLTRHITNVQQNCNLLGEKLIENDEFDFAKLLISSGLLHDNSKFHGMEWDMLTTENTDPISLKLSVGQHNKSNTHHPEYWGGIKKMPRIAIAELVCDWKERSSEFGTSLLEWIENNAMQRFDFNKNDDVYKEIMYFVNLLVDKPFKQV